MQLHNMLLSFLPWAVFFLVIYFIVYRGIFKDRRKSAENAEHFRMHCDAVEAKLDRLVELTERRESGG